MDLPYLVILGRPTYTSNGGIQPKPSYAFNFPPVRCDAFPLTDEILFLQPATQNASTIIFHFAYNQDVRVHDVVQLQHIDAIVGDPGAWFELQNIQKPHDLLQYTRAHAHVITKPPGAPS
jgi:hypothetical protein